MVECFGIMARNCSICSNPDRLAIDQGIIAGLPYRDISGRWGLSKSAVERHASSHIAAAIARAAELSERLTADALVGELRVLREVTLGVLEEARLAENHGVALHAIARLEKQAELVARLLGELVDRQRVELLDVALSERWIRLRAALLAALAPFDEARRAVISALAELGESI